MCVKYCVEFVCELKISEFVKISMSAAINPQNAFGCSVMCDSNEKEGVL